MKNAILVRRAVAPMDSGASTSLLPADAEAETVLTKIPLGETVEIQVRRGRSLPQHRLFRALLRHVAKATVWETDERLLLGLKIYFGKCDRVMLPNGKAILVAHSTSFPEMDQAEFQEFMDQSIQVICERIIPGTNSDDLIRDVELLLGWTSIVVPEEDAVLESPRAQVPIIAPGGESHSHPEFGSPESSTASERVERRDAPQESTSGGASKAIGSNESRSLSQTPESLSFHSFLVPAMQSSKGGALATLTALLARAMQIERPEDFSRLRQESAKTINYLREANRKLWNEWNTSSAEIERQLREKTRERGSQE